ncbi:hypothetical protein OHB35_52850 [Streptomyces phaeochromogenes]|uniref:Uncharacterized protein n=1 Tax=Streptomyces phaeochromogenes TaxID=1923 RepID=A0ABZ1HVC3_STRPH|nr:hypothetical protein [Streptomyces phaeochromogenes]WSD21235.1 hypothetical protein OHB35_52850 [Streptomyces phaeochromogenes]
MTLHDLLDSLGPVSLLVLLSTVMVFMGVVLPTIWSRHAYRRSAARTTMNTLLKALRRLYPF